jgi:hypothetical protein
MSGAERFSSTKTVLPWRARVYERAARMVRGGVTVQQLGTSGNEVNIQITGPTDLNQRFARRDANLLDRINYNKLTFNPLLIPFVWGTRNRRRKEEKAIRK